jgi:SOS response regulatory protein OraA/RecX
MTRDDIIHMAETCGIPEFENNESQAENILRFAALVAAHEREKVARWMVERGYATGHGDTIEDLLKELEWQVAEREREGCAKFCDDQYEFYGFDHVFAAGIRARGEK